MAEKYIKVKQEIEKDVLQCVICDGKDCGKVIDPLDHDHESYQTLSFSWGYNSDQEDQTWYATLCETCIKKNLLPLINFHFANTSMGFNNGENIWAFEEKVLQGYAEAFNLTSDSLRPILQELCKKEDSESLTGPLSSALSFWENSIKEYEILLASGIKPKNIDVSNWERTTSLSLLDLPEPIASLAAKRFGELEVRWNAILSKI